MTLDNRTSKIFCKIVGVDLWHKISYRNTSLIFMSDNLFSRMSSWKESFLWATCKIKCKGKCEGKGKGKYKCKDQVKGKAVPNLNWTSRHKGRWRSGFARLTSVLDGGDWSYLRPAQWNSGKRGLAGSQTWCVEFIDEKVFLACRELNHDGLFIRPIA